MDGLGNQRNKHALKVTDRLPLILEDATHSNSGSTLAQQHASEWLPRRLGWDGRACSECARDRTLVVHDVALDYKPTGDARALEASMKKRPGCQDCDG